MIRAVIVSLLALTVSATTTASNLTETSIRLEVYRSLYSTQAPDGVLPKVFVFSRDGKCVGVFTPEDTPTNGLWAAVENALERNETRCSLTHSAEFPGASESATRKVNQAKITLVLMREDFCMACGPYRDELVSGLPTRSSIAAEVVKLALPESRHEPEDRKDSCPTCASDD